MIVQEERSGPEGGAMSPELGEVGEVIRNSSSRLPDMELEDDIVESKYRWFLDPVDSWILELVELKWRSRKPLMYLGLKTSSFWT